MKMNDIKNHILCSLAMLCLIWGLQSCSEERFDIPDYTVTGEDVILKVEVRLPKMETQTRADLDEASLNEVESLWIRTYSADTGKATSEWLKVTAPSNTGTEIPHEATIATQSGLNYIVAVANVNNMGVTKDNINVPQRLSVLLEAADTWQDFLNIAVVSPSTLEDVRAPQTPLPMAGCYTDEINVGGTHYVASSIHEWQNADFQPYFIPAKNGNVDFSANGAIHMRRLVSHINFNVIPGSNDIDVTVNSYQVFNAPKYSWLYERPKEDGMITNFGDLASEETIADYYVNVPQYSSQYVSKDEAGNSSFDFWQAENKHTGTCDSYTDRDKRNQNDNALFTSLTGETWTPNNEASYVLIQCTVDYANQLQVDNEGALVAGGTLVTRTGEVTYLVHLGYIGNGQEAERAKDFNCFRNVDYTYNLTVNGINDVRLDAWADEQTPERYHGEEGMVIDLANSTIDIDAHYSVFNIYLTQAELEGNFGFIITTYDNGNQITISDENKQEGQGQSLVIYNRDGVTQIDPKYYNWIELRRTTGANVLATYKPRFGNNTVDSSDPNAVTFLLTDLQGGWRNMTDGMKSTSGWYTVFVNEYTYEPMYTGGTAGYANEEWNGQGGRPNWMGYVNQNPRRFYVRVTQHTSPDGNSLYARSKYGISQQSMMTYYSDQNFAVASGDIPAGTAIGVERENETEGMNLRHSFDGGTSTANGRWNTAQYLNGSATAVNNLSINSNTVGQRPQWANYIDADQPLEVGAVTGERTQGGPEIPARTIANGNPHKIPKLVNFTEGASYTFNDPQANNNYMIQSINACMSRNRDNNGNGRIEPDELRWFVPGMDQYLAIMLGEASLPLPLMPYERISQLPYVNNNNRNWGTSGNGRIQNDFYSRYMAVSSNSGLSVMWLMEGTSTSEYGAMHGWSGNQSFPWTIRCIRNLGSDLRTVANEDRVSKPYVHDANNRKITMNYYNLSSIRVNRYTSNGVGGGTAMPVHTISSPYNSLYQGFEYAPSNLTIPTDSRPDTSSENQFFNTYDRLDTYINSNPCGADGLNYGGTGWRIPNQEELTIMRNLGILTANGANTTWLSCTVNYFNRTTGVGSTTDTSDRMYLVVTPSQGTQLTQANMSSANGSDAIGRTNGFYVRCVRDINN